MEFQFTTPSTITVRRNPRRKARDTPSSNAPDLPATSQLSSIKPLSLEEILEPEPKPELDPPPPQIPPSLTKPSDEEEQDAPQNLTVFLRIRPLLDLKPGLKIKSPNKGPKSKAQLEKDKLAKKNKKRIQANHSICLVANDSHSVTLTVPPSLNESKRKKSEIYDGFRHVFPSDSLQSEVYERVMEPLVSDFIKGKSRLLAALGPTGSGKTHTVFGCPREPGLVPLALRRLFDQSSRIGGATGGASRSFCLSMFEICSERGKGERISDLSTDVANVCFQQSAIKGVKEVMVTDIAQAECFISCGLLKRTTAATNANNQSSRSQCIINIRSASTMHGDEVGFAQNDAVLTIVDLAGAERERRTGIQGARLLESNFINNTSMIFGLCLRSLLEHQKNPKKPLEKHFQNSLLTKYLRDYLEGKKRMSLILTAKAGEDDYVDTSFLLRQASPYMKIKFLNTEELPNMPCQKRNIPPSNRKSKLKRRKCKDAETFLGSSEIGGKSGKGVCQTLGNDGNIIAEQLQKLELQQDLVSPLLSNVELQRLERKYQIMQDFSKALWNVLKQYKKKFEVSENEVQSLQESLRNEKVLLLDLEKQQNKLKSSCSCHAGSSTKTSSNSEVISTNFSGVDSHSTKKASEHNSNGEINDTSVRQNLEMGNSNEVVGDSELSTTEFKCENFELPLGSQESPAKEVDRSNRCDVLGSNGDKRLDSSSKHLNVEKPRRKLLPASTMLVKEVGAFDMEDDNPKNNKKAEKMAAVGGRRQTHGSISLLRLLRNNL